ncbi:uncharacterized protein LAJ45_10845 [Morchella importuna]|uniref:uncharacterized protein n=1 Tax=Morchella importuna TaxID=1174673 RepID=UPI001E8E56E6|nr:uncharacterized protein LAJ45_10845 [Morchella importuna]KAH8145181.1 hypothetical protein LAJ45_10845 [Morchella importuna]
MQLDPEAHRTRQSSQDYLGAIENVPPAAVPPVRPVEVQITDSEELEGAGANLGGAESPLLNPAFPHVEEDDYSMIDIPAEDSDYEEGKHG